MFVLAVLAIIALVWQVVTLRTQMWAVWKILALVPEGRALLEQQGRQPPAYVFTDLEKRWLEQNG